MPPRSRTAAPIPTAARAFVAAMTAPAMQDRWVKAGWQPPKVTSGVIPGRAEGASPEIQKHRDFLLFWIPGSPLRGAPNDREGFFSSLLSRRLELLAEQKLARRLWRHRLAKHVALRLLATS